MTQRVLLVVDDEENILRALVRLLRRDGYAILTANSGAQGLELLQQHPVGVILSDQRMPGMTGSEFLERAKALNPASVRMMLSGYTDLQSVTDAINRGAIYRFLTKPWDDEQLRENIRQAFEHYEHSAAAGMGRSSPAPAAEQIAAVAQGVASHAAAGAMRPAANAEQILEHLPVGVLGVAEDGVVVFANAMAEAMLDATCERLPGRTAASVLPPVLHDICMALEQGQTLERRQLRLGDGSGTLLVRAARTGASGRILVLIPERDAAVAGEVDGHD